MSNDNILVAPRPVRVQSLPATRFYAFKPVTPSVDALARLKLADDDELAAQDDLTPTFGWSSNSPQTSSRLSSSPEVLEEFFSILRSSMGLPNSPVLRTRRQATTSLAPVAYERPHPYKNREKYHSRNASGSDEADARMNTPPSLSEGRDNDQYINLGWRTPGVLESPVSRNQTRNPFQRHPSYDIYYGTLASNRRSPAMLPLPPSPLSETTSASPEPFARISALDQADPF